MRAPTLCSLLLLGCGAADLDIHEEAYVDHDLGVSHAGLNTGDAGGCDTSIVAALTGQLVSELNCISPNVMVDFRAPNITLTGAVQPFLNPAAASAMKSAVDGSGTSITLSSAYRSVAQQYLLLKWYRAGQCGIQAAALPGNSNHQSGRAIDVPSYSFWIPKLEARGWKWFGSGDVVHFDFLAAPNLGSNSVLAFQRLWNRNHATGKLAEDGQWGAATEGAMAASPTTGFSTFGCDAPPPTQKGSLKGRVYRVNPADPGDLSQGIASATVTVGTTQVPVDATGVYSIDLAPGTYTVTAAAAGFAPGSLARMVTAGQTIWGSVGLTPTGAPDTEPPDVELSSPLDGASLGAAQITLTGTASDAQGTVARFTLSVDGAPPVAVPLSSGAFSIAVHLAPGVNTLRFAATDDRGNAATLDARLTFRTGVEGLVLSPSGALEAATVEALDASAATVASVQSAVDGSFQLELLPGHYTLRSHAPGFATLSVPVEIGAEQRESATLTLMPEGIVLLTDEDLRVTGGCAAAPAGPLLIALLALLGRRSRRR